MIDRGKVNVQDVALEIGISPDSLTATLAVMHKLVIYLFFILVSEAYSFCSFFFVMFLLLRVG